jgi:AcrR family transcriptional regulator
VGRRADNKADKHRRLVAAALAEFSASGFDAATVEGIVARAGVARGTFYLYFPDKLAIFEAIADEWAVPVGGLLEDVAAEVGRAGDFDALVAVWQAMATGLAILAVSSSDALTLAFREIRGAGPAARALQARERRIVATVVRFTDDAARRGLVRVPDARLAAWVVIGATERLVWEALQGELTSADGVAEQVVAWFRAAFRP